MITSGLNFQFVTDYWQWCIKWQASPLALLVQIYFTTEGQYSLRNSEPQSDTTSKYRYKCEWSDYPIDGMEIARLDIILRIIWLDIRAGPGQTYA